MNQTPVTLDTPDNYFQLLDRSSIDHWWGRGIERIERCWIIHAIRQRQLINDKKLNWLDAGCGSGARLLQWSGWGCWGRLVGIDPEIQSGMKISGKENLPIELKKGHLPEMQLKGDRFDLITSFDVIQHVSFEARRQAIGEMADHLAVNGLLLIRTNASGFFRRKLNDRSIVRPEFLDECLKENGLKPLRRCHFNLTGSLAEDIPAYLTNRKRNNDQPLKHGLPNGWQKRPRGSLPGQVAGWAESQIAATGLVKLPFGHSYIMLATKE